MSVRVRNTALHKIKLSPNFVLRGSCEQGQLLQLFHTKLLKPLLRTKSNAWVHEKIVSSNLKF